MTWKKVLFHSVLPNDDTYETVMDLVFRRDEPDFRSPRLDRLLEDIQTNSSRRNIYHRLRKKASLFSIDLGYLVYIHQGALPWAQEVTSVTSTGSTDPSRVTLFRVVRPSERQEVLKESYHNLSESGMCGYQAMYYHLVATLHLLGITQVTIQDFLKQTPFHRMARNTPDDLAPVKSFQPQVPLEHFQMDITDLKLARNTVVKLAVIVDIFSRYTWATVLAEDTADEYIRFVKQVLEEELEKPKRFQTDNGAPFTSQAFSGYLSQQGVYHFTSNPYRPQTNGFVEQKHYVIKSRILAFKASLGPSVNTNAFKAQLPKRLQEVLYTINQLKIQRISLSPVQIHKGFFTGAIYDPFARFPSMIVRLTDPGPPRQPRVSTCFPMLRQASEKIVRENKKVVVAKDTKYVQGNKVRIATVFRSAKGYRSSVFVYPWTYEYTEQPPSDVPFEGQQFIDKTRVKQWSKRIYVVAFAHKHKVYLADPNGIPILRLVKRSPLECSRFFLSWQLLPFEGQIP